MIGMSNTGLPSRSDKNDEWSRSRGCGSALTI
jgi:hypothetical protein